MRSGDTDKLLQLCERFDEHVKHFQAHEDREERFREDQLHRDQQQTEALRQVAEGLRELTEATRPVVEFQRDFTGMARMGDRVQGLLVALAKWGTIGGGVAYAIHWVLEHAPRH